MPVPRQRPGGIETLHRSALCGRPFIEPACLFLVGQGRRPHRVGKALLPVLVGLLRERKAFPAAVRDGPAKYVWSIAVVLCRCSARIRISSAGIVDGCICLLLSLLSTPRSSPHTVASCMGFRPARWASCIRLRTGPSLAGCSCVSTSRAVGRIEDMAHRAVDQNVLGLGTYLLGWRQYELLRPASGELNQNRAGIEGNG